MQPNRKTRQIMPLNPISSVQWERRVKGRKLNPNIMQITLHLIPLFFLHSMGQEEVSKTVSKSRLTTVGMETRHHDCPYFAATRAETKHSLSVVPASR